MGVKMTTPAPTWANWTVEGVMGASPPPQFQRQMTRASFLDLCATSQTPTLTASSETSLGCRGAAPGSPPRSALHLARWGSQPSDPTGLATRPRGHFSGRSFLPWGLGTEGPEERSGP